MNNKYVVIREFIDLSDGHKSHYKPGCIYPRVGVDVSDERIKALSSPYNKQEKTLIMAITELEPIEVKEPEEVEEKAKPKKTTKK